MIIDSLKYFASASLLIAPLGLYAVQGPSHESSDESYILMAQTEDEAIPGSESELSQDPRSMQTDEEQEEEQMQRGLTPEEESETTSSDPQEEAGQAGQVEEEEEDVIRGEQETGPEGYEEDVGPEGARSSPSPDTPDESGLGDPR